MLMLKLTGLGLLALILLALLALALLSRRHRRRVAAVEAALVTQPGSTLFHPELVQALPDPARRYLEHAIARGTPLASGVMLSQRARMKPSLNGDHIPLTAEERLLPRQGLVWRARASIGPLSLSILDHYYAGDGAVHLALLGTFRLGHQGGPDVTRSSRGRLALEALWCPSSLLPGPGVRWEAVDQRRARVIQLIDSEELAMVLCVAEGGQLLEATMERHGDVGRRDYGPIPYGFAIQEHRTFGGYTIPTRLEGGWGFGTGRYRKQDANTFIVLGAQFF